jgi:tRNA modification GTPase
MALRVYIEGAMDFPDEEADWLAGRQVAVRLDDIAARFARIEAAARQGRALRDGLMVVIAGPPNAGKSSLLNALAGHDAAIVTEMPGTTRDVLREHIVVDGLPVHVVDTAGLRDTVDVIESEGVRRARAEIARADLVLYVMDVSAAPRRAAVEADLAALHSDAAVLKVWNKIDLAEGSDPILGSDPGVDRGLTPLGSDPSEETATVVDGWEESDPFGVRLHLLGRRLSHSSGSDPLWGLTPPETPANSLTLQAPSSKMRPSRVGP